MGFTQNLGPNVWANADSSYFFYFQPFAFRWICYTENQQNECFAGSSFTFTDAAEAGWQVLSAGESYNDGTLTISCSGTIPTMNPSPSPTSAPTEPTMNPIPPPTSAPVTAVPTYEPTVPCSGVSFFGTMVSPLDVCTTISSGGRTISKKVSCSGSAGSAGFEYSFDSSDCSGVEINATEIVAPSGVVCAGRRCPFVHVRVYNDSTGVCQGDYEEQALLTGCSYFATEDFSLSTECDVDTSDFSQKVCLNSECASSCVDQTGDECVEMIECSTSGIPPTRAPTTSTPTMEPTAVPSTVEPTSAPTSPTYEPTIENVWTYRPTTDNTGAGVSNKMMALCILCFAHAVVVFL